VVGKERETARDGERESERARERMRKRKRKAYVCLKEREREREREREKASERTRDTRMREKEGERTGQENGGKIIFKYSYQNKKKCVGPRNYWRPNETREIRKRCETIGKERKREAELLKIFIIYGYKYKLLRLLSVGVLMCEQNLVGR